MEKKIESVMNKMNKTRAAKNIKIFFTKNSREKKIQFTLH